MDMLRDTKLPGHPKFSNTKHDEAAYYSAGQTHRSIRLFDRACVGENPETAWTVFLRYDTDEYNSDITKFHEGDWGMLCDLPGVLSFLGLPSETEMPPGNRGKTKLKKLYRKVAPNMAYHSGECAKGSISHLDMAEIRTSAPVPLGEIDRAVVSG